MLTIRFYAILLISVTFTAGIMCHSIHCSHFLISKYGVLCLQPESMRINIHITPSYSGIQWPFPDATILIIASFYHMKEAERDNYGLMYLDWHMIRSKWCL